MTRSGGSDSTGAERAAAGGAAAGGGLWSLIAVLSRGIGIAGAVGRGQQMVAPYEKIPELAGSCS